MVNVQVPLDTFQVSDGDSSVHYFRLYYITKMDVIVFAIDFKQID
jgi:hypothetical protein